MLFHFSQYYAEYVPQLIEMVAKNQLKIAVDLGLNTIEGEFEGINSVVRAVEVWLSIKSFDLSIVKLFLGQKIQTLLIIEKSYSNIASFEENKTY